MRSKSVFVLVFGLVAMLSALTAGAQLTATDSEFQVNTATTHEQEYPDVAQLADGRFVVVWQSYTFGDLYSGHLIKAQGFDATGSPVGSEFQITTMDWYINDRHPKVAATASDGGFVVVWDREYRVGSTGNGFEVMARLANLEGAAFGAEIRVTDPSAATQIEPAVAVLPNSDFVVVWNDDGDAYGTNLQGQRFDASGTPQSGQFRVDGLTYQSRNNRRPAVAAQSDSSFTVVWESERLAPTTDEGDIFAIRRNATGASLGTPIRLNETLTDAQLQPDIATTENDGTLVAWGDETERDMFDTNIFARRLAANGSPVGGEFQVNVTGYDRVDSDPSVDATHAGDFVVVWARNEFLMPAEAHGIVGRVVSGTGSLVGNQAILNQFPSVWLSPKQAHPAVAAGGGGRVLATWDSDGSLGTDSDRHSIAARKAALAEIFLDGFESGNTSAWSTSIP